MAKELHIVTAFFGEDHGRMLIKVMWPLLWHHNHECLQEMDYRHIIYCREQDRSFLYWGDQGRFNRGRVFNTKIMPNVPVSLTDEGRANYHALRHIHLCQCIQDAFQNAIDDDAIIMLAPPDHLFGYGLANILAKMEQGTFLVCGHSRVSLDKAWPLLLREPMFKNNGELVDFAFKTCPHKVTQFGLENDTNYWDAVDVGDRYIAWIRDPVPILIDPTPDLLRFWQLGGYNNNPPGNFEMLDHDLVGHSLNKGRLKMVTDSNQFFHCELTPDCEHEPTVCPKGSSPTEDLFGRTELVFWKGNHA